MSPRSSEFILLDIEGTTTPLDFVKEELFPYAQAHLEDYLGRHSGETELEGDLKLLLSDHAEDERQGLDPPSLQPGREPWRTYVPYLRWLMERDRKSRPLKSIQGKIWEEGYGRGTLKSRLFPDVPRAFLRWTTSGKRIFIFSSGSVLAQQLLFRHTESGDLTRHISGYFDTNIGPKIEPESYRKIAERMDRAPQEVAFVSDATKELVAAGVAGMNAFLAIRPGNVPDPHSERSYPVIKTFDDWP